MLSIMPMSKCGRKLRARSLESLLQRFLVSQIEPYSRLHLTFSAAAAAAVAILWFGRWTGSRRFPILIVRSSNQPLSHLLCVNHGLYVCAATWCIEKRGALVLKRKITLMKRSIGVPEKWEAYFRPQFKLLCELVPGTGYTGSSKSPEALEASHSKPDFGLCELIGTWA